MPSLRRLLVPYLAGTIALTHLFLMASAIAGQGTTAGAARQGQQKKAPSATGSNKPKMAAAPVGQGAKTPAAYIQDIESLNAPNYQLSISLDATEIVGLMGKPDPFSLKPVGTDTVVIYCSKRKSNLTADEKALLEEIKTNIHELAANQGQPIEIPIAHPSALGDLVKQFERLNYDGIKIEAVGTDKIRATCDARVSPARFQAFLRDVQHLALQPKAESPVARVFFINAPEAAGVLGGSEPAAKSKKDSQGPSGAQAGDTPVTSSKSSSGKQSANKSGDTAAEKETTDNSSVAAKPAKEASDGSTGDSIAAENEKGSGTTASADKSGEPKPSPGNQASSAPTVASLNYDLLVFSDEHPGDDAAITERKRILAAVDFPRPEVIINTFSFQTSSTHPDVLYETADVVRRQMGLYNDGLQDGIGRAWGYLQKQIDGKQFFNPEFYSYLTKYYVADADNQSGGKGLAPASAIIQGDLSKVPVTEQLAKLSGDRNQYGICDTNKYCLGYTSLFHPLRPSLTDMLLAVIASNTPGTHIKAAIDALEGRGENGEFQDECRPGSCKTPALQLCREKSCSRTCEEADEDELERHDFTTNRQMFIFPMNCFRHVANEVFPEDSASPSLVGPLRAAFANFLFHYKMSQQYPHEFSPYDLSESAQELNSELNPLVLAFNRDLAAALRPLKYAADPLKAKGNGWFGFSGHGNSFVNNGILTVRTISGKETVVDTATQSFFDATNMPSITDVVNAMGTAESNAPSVIKTNLTANEAALIIGALTSVKPSTSKVGREFKIDITPRSLSGASAAELDIKMNTRETADPTLYTNGKSDSDNLSRVAQHSTQTKVRLESAKLFEISSFTAMLQRSRKNFPLLPPLVEIPYIGSIISLPVPGAKEYHSSTAIMSAVVVPTAADLANGLVFTSDRVAIANDDAGGDCALDSARMPNCSIRRAASMNELGAYSVRNYHKALVSCFGSSVPFPSIDSKGAVVTCSTLGLTTFPSEAP
jgi:hypothetical protein